MKITLTIILFMFGGIALGFSGGDGTVETPYGISTAEDLQAVRDNMSAIYILLNDIDMYDIKFEVLAEDWNSPFYGTFDGNGKIIKNLVIHSDGSPLASLFGNIASQGVVKKLGLSNVRIESSNAKFVGGIAGWNKGTIENCFVSGNILGFSMVGAIAGGVNEDGVIRNCFSYCVVTSVDEIAGGITGELSGTARMENCFAYGNTYGGSWFGGLAGRSTEQAVLSCSLYNSDFTKWSALGQGINGSSLCSASNIPSECGLLKTDENGGAVWKMSASDSVMKGWPVLSWVDLSLVASPFSPIPGLPKSQIKTDVFEPGALWHDLKNVHINAHTGSILSYNGKYYWFGQYMSEGQMGVLSWVGVSCYSSQDLYNWVKEEIALSVVENVDSDIVKGCKIERPCVIYNAKTGKFVMWFNLEAKNAGVRSLKTAVAIADSPAGPYKYLYSFRPNANFWPTNITDEQKQLTDGNFLSRDFAGGQMSNDSTLFVDDDGKAYQIYTSEENKAIHISLLTDDYLRPSGQYARIDNLSAVYSSSVFKYDGRYYIISSKSDANSYGELITSVAPSIWGPWKEIGNPCDGEGADKSFFSQGGYVIPAASMPGKFIFMAERLMLNNAVESRYVWLPMYFAEGAPVIRWYKSWDLSVFEEPKSAKKKLLF